MTVEQIVAECQRLCGWSHHGCEMPMRPTLPEVFGLIAAYYTLPGNDVGGELHVVFEDGNYKRRFIWTCQVRAVQPVTRWLCRVLLLLSGSQRRKMARRGRSKGTDAVSNDGGAGSTPASRHL